MSKKRAASHISSDGNDDMSKKRQAVAEVRVDGRKENMEVSRDNTISYSSSPMVKITLGTERRDFYVHRALLMAYSAYFTNILASDLIKKKSLEVDLLDYEESAFDCLVQWLYHGNLDGSIVRSAFWRIMYLYKLADKLVIPDLKDMIVDMYRHELRKSRIIISPKYTVTILEKGLSNTRLGRFALRSFVYFLCNNDAKKANHTLRRARHTEALENIYKHQESLKVFTTCLLEYQKQPWGDPRLADDAEFHECDPEIEKSSESWF